ncbi:Hypothetical Protein FCC1311_054852 [Hondaea fermentalgiana]|uniref:Uncharacterized protein n=1 Tax=Hondaea fermentalgiana TaxID=2315210 RepID=A0A2R5GKW6_9STRA|nr:Hypothetical Protein FCC1311_054852 [Hondaea fermentalgiana]|eukprot:GBG29263.1 Hypothetical Protein FCC1311_054852 [Hondaea fermentalgiana]
MPAYAEVPQNEDGNAPESNTAARQKRVASRNWVVIAVIALFAGLVLMSISKDREALDAAAATSTQVEAKDIINNFGDKMDYFQKIAHDEKTYSKKVRQEEAQAERERKRQEKLRKQEEARLKKEQDEYDSEAEASKSASKKKNSKAKAPAPTTPPPTPSPTSKFSAPSETIYDFLYKHTDGSLILHSTSIEEEESIPAADLNVITLTIQAMANNGDDSMALAQVAIWFARIAQAWPTDIELTDNAKESLDFLLRMDFDSVSSNSAFVQSLVDFKITSEDGNGKVVFNTEGFKDLQEKHSAASSAASAVSPQGEPTPAPETKEERFKETQIEKVVSGLLDSGDISGGKPVERLRVAVEAHETLEEWNKLLIFTLAVAEARPVFQEYVKRWRQGKFIRGKLLSREEIPPEKKSVALANAAEMLQLLEDACEAFPRVNDLLRAVFYEFLTKGPSDDDLSIPGSEDDDDDDVDDEGGATDPDAEVDADADQTP